MRPREYEVEDLAAYRGRIDAVTQRACSSFRRDASAIIARYGEPSTWTRAEKAEIRDSVAALMSGHIDGHSAATQSLASRFVEDVLEAQGAGMTVDVAERDVSYPARQSARYWYRRLDEGDVDGFVSGCESFVKRSVSHAGDISLLDGATGKKGKARLRYARVPSGPTCPFCLLLASRGFDYLTPESAGELSRFHDDCDCRVVAGYDGLKVKGYDYEGMRRRIGACRETIGTPEEVRREFAALDRAEKSRYGRGVRVSNVELPEELVERIGEQANAFNDYYCRRLMEEMRTRDRAWLFDGTEPRLGYENEAVKASKNANRTRRADHERELKTAKKLRDNGFETVFVEDETKSASGDVVGHADLANGIEIKTVYKASSENTISKHIANCKGKKNLSRIVVDISENPNLTDAEATDYIAHSIWRHGFGEAFVLRHDGRLSRVRPERPGRNE